MFEESNYFLYNGQIDVELSQNVFMFYTRNGIQQLCVFYKYPGCVEDRETLSMKLKISHSKTSVVTMTIERVNQLSEKEKKLEISMLTPAIMMDTFKEEYQVFKKSLQIFGKYKISSPGKVIEAVFKHRKGIQYAVIVDEYTKVHDAYDFLCKVWPLRCESTKYCISTKGGVIDEDKIFKDFGKSCKVKFWVAERCDIAPLCGEREKFIMPWNKRSSVMLEYLSKLLGLSKDEVHLIDKDKKVVRENLKLDIVKFREEGTKNSVSFWYDISKKFVKCVSIGSKNKAIQMTILRDSNVSEIKKKLAKELNVDVKRFLISQRKLVTKVEIVENSDIIIKKEDILLGDEEIILDEEDINYFLGSTLDGVLIEESKGNGTFGEVFKSKLKTTGKVIALKKFNIDISDKTKCISVIREIVVMLTIPPHTNLIKYLDVYIQDYDIYMGIEYMEKGSLRQYLKEKRHLEEEQIKGFSSDILKGLAHLHENSVNHRDIKGDNVLLGVNFIAKLCDFGISTILNDFNTVRNVNQTKEMGTIGYMAPEVINGGQYAFSSDIWSFGATVIEMLTGHSPYHGCERAYILRKVGTEKVIEFDAPMTKNLKSFINACLEPEAKDRPKAKDLLLFDFIKD